MSVITTDLNVAAARPRITAGFQTRLPRRLSLALTVWMERRALAQLDDRRLADLGLTQAAARAEARRPLWDLPENRGNLRGRG